MEIARKIKEPYFPEVLANGDTIKQLLARSRCLLYKSEHNWSTDQQQRANLLFERYPDLEKAYKLSKNFLGYSIRQKIKSMLLPD